MNKSELITALMAEANLSKRDAASAVAAFCNVVSHALKRGDVVTLVGFGTFRASKRSAREGRNPKTGELVKIKASISPTFKAGKSLRDAVN